MNRKIATLVLLVSQTVAMATPPAVSVPPLTFKPGPVERVVLKNGVVVYIKEDHELPTFDASLRMRTSPADNPSPDVFSFTGAVWRAGGTVTRPPDKLNEELERMAVSVETGVDMEGATVSVSCLSKNIDKALSVFSDVLFHPAFQADQLSLVKDKTLESLRRKNETPAQIGRRAFRDVVYGKDHVYALESTEASVKKVTRQDLIDLHKKIVVPDQAILSVTGDFDKNEMLAAFEKMFESWKPVGRSAPPFDFAVRETPPGSIFFVQKEANQSRITIGRVGPARHNPDHFALQLTDYLFGGGGPSRLFGDIRSRRGLAYMVGSFYQVYAGPGLLGVVCQTKAGSTIGAVKAIEEQIDKLTQGPIGDGEVRLAKEAIVNSFVFGFDSTRDLVNQRATHEFLGFAPDYLDTYTARVNAVTKRQVHQTARKYYARSSMRVMIVGDEKKFDAPLSSLGDVITIPLSDIP